MPMTEQRRMHLDRDHGSPGTGPEAHGADGRVTLADGLDAYEAVLRDSSDLLVSVILPLPDHRGLAEQSARSWAVEQTLPRDRYEVLVITDGSQPAVEPQVAALLRPHDRLLVIPRGNEAHFYAAGAAEARGRWLFFTEAHVLGAPDCLEKVVRALLTTGANGVACRSGAICTNAFGRSEHRVFQEVSRVRLATGHWSKLFLRGSAISRRVFDEVGGLNARYGLFAEPDLAARLHARGHRISYAPDALVVHLNTANVAELRESIHSYVSGECAYRIDHPAGDGDAYFGTPSWWLRRARLDADVDRSIWTSLGRSLALTGAGWRERCRRWLALTPAAAVGGRAPIWRARLDSMRTALRCWWWRNDDDRMLPAFRDLYAKLVMEFGLEALASAGPDADAERRAGDTEYRLADLPEHWLAGFHLREAVDGETFRWSGPAACLKLPLDPSDRLLRLRTRGLRPDVRLLAYLNGRRLPVRDYQAERGEIWIALRPRNFRPAPFQYLVLLCEPLRPWLHGVSDRRELGLPIFRIARGVPGGPASTDAQPASVGAAVPA
jgi:hypothetical protein